MDDKIEKDALLIVKCFRDNFPNADIEMEIIGKNANTSDRSKKNEKLIDQSSLVVIIENYAGEARNTVKYAEQQFKEIIFLHT